MQDNDGDGAKQSDWIHDEKLVRVAHIDRRHMNKASLEDRDTWRLQDICSFLYPTRIFTSYDARRRLGVIEASSEGSVARPFRCESYVIVR